MRPSIIEFLEVHGLDMVTLLFPTKGIIYVLAMAAAVWLFLRRSAQIGLPTDRTLPAAAASAVACIVGARIYHLLGSGTGLAIGPAALLSSDRAGSWGGYLGGLFGMWAYLRLTRTDPRPYLDVAPGAVALAPVIGRWGCLLAGCDFGRVTSVPWAIHYPAGSHAFHAHLLGGELPIDASQSLAVHPLPIYLSLNALALFLIITAIWRRNRHRPGITLAAAWILYGGTRFFWEFLRDPAAGGAGTGLSLPQWMALLAIGIGCALGVVASRKWRMDTATIAATG